MSARSMSSTPGARMPLLKSRARSEPNWCSSTIRVVGRRNVSGRSRICRLSLTGFFWLMPTKRSRRELEEEIRRSHQRSKYQRLLHFPADVFSRPASSPWGRGFLEAVAFRRGKGGYECRLKDQDSSMADMEIHEHVAVEGATARLKNPLAHRNVESLSRYIRKHDEYSNWEAKVWLESEANGQLAPSFFGTQAQRRRWLKSKFLGIPGAPVWFFLFKYLFSLGFLDGVPGLIYCGFQAVQVFHVKSKIYELRRVKRERRFKLRGDLR